MNYAKLRFFHTGQRKGSEENINPVFFGSACKLELERNGQIKKKQ
jgi:hypothetical protein